MNQEQPADDFKLETPVVEKIFGPGALRARQRIAEYENWQFDYYADLPEPTKTRADYRRDVRLAAKLAKRNSRKQPIRDRLGNRKRRRAAGL